MYVILRPHSNTNSTNFYKIMNLRDWARLIKGYPDNATYWPASTYEAAVLIRDELNAKFKVSN